MRSALLLLALIAERVACDLYMHNPRGSNNKLNEVSNNARNQNRLFDSQNNAAGGYQVGDDCKPVCSNAANQYNKSAPGAGKGQMYYYEGSRLTIEWTNQHGCGDAQKNVRCNIVLQYMCNDSAPALRDGSTTDRVPDTQAGYEDEQYGVHENLTWYENCKARSRNKGLYTADQNLNGNRVRAINTRQNPNGNRRGLECPEERDYYPYWHPTPWRDIAVLTDDMALCPLFESESQNVLDKGMCCNRTVYEAQGGECVQQKGDPEERNGAGANNFAACENADNENRGVWVEFGRCECARARADADNDVGSLGLGGSMPARSSLSARCKQLASLLTLRAQLPLSSHFVLLPPLLLATLPPLAPPSLREHVAADVRASALCPRQPSRQLRAEASGERRPRGDLARAVV